METDTSGNGAPGNSMERIFFVGVCVILMDSAAEILRSSWSSIVSFDSRELIPPQIKEVEFSTVFSINPKFPIRNYRGDSEIPRNYSSIPREMQKANRSAWKTELRSYSRCMIDAVATISRIPGRVGRKRRNLRRNVQNTHSTIGRHWFTRSSFTSFACLSVTRRLPNFYWKLNGSEVLAP